MSVCSSRTPSAWRVGQNSRRNFACSTQSNGLRRTFFTKSRAATNRSAPTSICIPGLSTGCLASPTSCTRRCLHARVQPAGARIAWRSFQPAAKLCGQRSSRLFIRAITSHLNHAPPPQSEQRASKQAPSCFSQQKYRLTAARPGGIIIRSISAEGPFGGTFHTDFPATIYPQFWRSL